MYFLSERLNETGLFTVVVGIGWYWSGLIKDIIICFLLSIFPMSIPCAPPPTHPQTHHHCRCITHWNLNHLCLLYGWYTCLFTNQQFPPAIKNGLRKHLRKNNPCILHRKTWRFRPGKSLNSKRHATEKRWWPQENKNFHVHLIDLPMFFYETSKSLYTFSNGLVTISWCIDRVLSAQNPQKHEQYANQITTSWVSLPAYVLLWRSILLGLCCQQTSWTMQRA